MSSDFSMMVDFDQQRKCMRLVNTRSQNVLHTFPSYIIAMDEDKSI